MGCPSDKAYAICRGTKLHRITFSRSLAEHICKTLGDGFYPARCTFSIGKRLAKGESSSTGIFALISERSGRALRISLIQGIAEVYCDWDSRYLAEASITHLTLLPMVGLVT